MTGFRKILLWSVAVIAAIAAFAYTQQKLESTHTREVLIYFSAQQWVVGELRTCHSFSTKQKGELTSLRCDNDTNESHLLRVTFSGSISTELTKTWKCERGESDIICELQ